MKKQQQKSDSPLSTQSATPQGTDITSLLIGKENRFNKKGFFLLIGFAIACAYVYLFSYGMHTIWPRFLQFMDDNNIQQWHVFTFGIWIWNLFWLIFYNSIMVCIYKLELPFFEKYKINSNPWPWNEDKEEWMKLFKKSILLILLNQGVTTPTLIFSEMHLNNYVIRMSFATEDIPSPIRLILTLVFFILCEDLTFFFMHKMGHSRLFYRFHKHHHNYINSVSITGQHWHPIDYIIGGLIPVAIGPMLLQNKIHIVTYLAWVVARQGESVDCHCGFEFPWSPFRLLPFSTSAQYHDFHHTHNVGNFSSYFTLWDTVFGDNHDYFQFKKKVQDQQKEFNEQLREKLEKTSKAKVQ